MLVLRPPPLVSSEVVTRPFNARTIYIRFLCKFIHLICCEVVISCASAVAASTYFLSAPQFSRVGQKHRVPVRCITAAMWHCLSHTLQMTRNSKHWKQNTNEEKRFRRPFHRRPPHYLPLIAFITDSVDKLQSVSEKCSAKITKKRKWPREWSMYLKKSDRLETFDSI